MKTKTRKPRSILIIVMLILAGEAVFILPFVLARIFRPTFLDVFNLTNLEHGICGSIYGVVAMVSYIFGFLADRFHPKNLMSLALILTSLGGFYMATYPSYFEMKILFGYWGFTTIFLFWAAMIKATRIWGGANMQGRAFGFLDGGRGLVAACFGLLGVYIFSIFISTSIEEASFTERQAAFKQVIIVSSSIVFVIGVLTFFVLKSLKTENFKDYEKKLLTITGIKSVLKLPTVWLLMLIILSAYVGYKLTDDISLFANEVMGYDEIESAKIGTMMLYIRPFIGVAIGFIADKTKASLWLIIGFAIALVSSILFAFGNLETQGSAIFILSVILMAIGVYSARVLYFAVMRDGHIPLALTGTAVGLISLIGYTPDIFVGPVMGYFLDNHSALIGHKYVFLFMMAFCLLGLVASALFYRVSGRLEKQTPAS